MFSFPLFLALKYLRPKRSFVSVVTLISIVGVLLGVAILVIVQSVMTGFDDMWREKILNFKPHLTVVNRHTGIQDEDRLCERIAALEGVTGVAAAVETRVLMQHAGRMVAPMIVGVTPDRAAGISRVPQHVIDGEFDLSGDNAVVGYDLARGMEIEVGSRILVYSPLNVLSEDELYLPEELTVAGIFSLGMRDYDSGFVLTSIDVTRELVGMETGAYALHVMTRDAFLFEEFAERVRTVLPQGYEVRTWKEIDSVLFAALSHEKTMMFVLLVFITIVAIFCVTNTLIVITVQKTNEIGLLKALGFSSNRIMAAFVWLGWIQCLIGTLAGIGVGLLILNNLEHVVAGLRVFDIEAFPKSIYGLSEIPWSTSLGELATISAIVIIFCTVCSIIPARRAAGLDPVDALRGE